MPIHCLNSLYLVITNKSIDILSKTSSKSLFEQFMPLIRPELETCPLCNSSGKLQTHIGRVDTPITERTPTLSTYLWVTFTLECWSRVLTGNPLIRLILHTFMSEAILHGRYNQLEGIFIDCSCSLIANIKIWLSYKMENDTPFMTEPCKGIHLTHGCKSIM